MKKITKTITIAIVSIAVLAAGISQISNMDDTAPIEAQALIGGEGTLAEQRAAILESGVIPDYYLISKTGDIWETHMTPDEITKFERVFVSTLNTGEDTNHNTLSTTLSLTGQNLVTLMEKPDTHLDEVSALVLHGKTLDGTYVVPTSEPVQKYHEYILDVYADSLPDTIEGVEASIIELTGEMAPLAHIALDVHEQWAETGVVSFDQMDEDPHYWWAVLDLFKCEHNGEDDCSTHQDHLDNKRWLEEDPEFIEPPGQDWPPIFNFIIPFAYAWSYVSMDYELTYILGGCAGRCPTITAVSSSTNTYLSSSWEPPMGPSEGCGHLVGTGVRTIFSVERNVTTAYSAAVLQTTANGIYDDDTDSGFRDKVSAITQTRVSDNRHSTWCYEASYVGYSLN